MEEDFKKKIETKIDNIIDHTKKLSDTENKDLNNKAESLRSQLKKMILKKEILDENEITNNEWQEILQSLPKELLEEFGIQQYTDDPTSPTQQLIYFILFKTYFEEKYQLSYSQISPEGFVSGNRKIIAKINIKTQHIDRERNNLKSKIKDIDEILDINPQNGIINGRNGFARIDINTGNVLWTQKGLTGFDMIYQYGQWVTDNGIDVIKINPETGKIERKTSLSELTSPIYRFKESIFHNNNKSIALMDLNTGIIKWNIEIPAELGTTDNNEIQIPRDGIIKCKNGLLKVDIQNGNILWINSHIKEEFGDNYKYSKEGFISDNNTKIGKINLKTGTILRKKENSGDIDQMNDLHFVRGSNGTRVIIRGRDHNGKNVAKIDEQGNFLFKTSDIPNTTIALLKSLKIERYQRFYSIEFINHIIKNRNLLKDKDCKELQNKPVTVIFFPKRDENGSYLHNNIDEFMKSSNVLYFEIENEQDMYQELSKLKSLDIKVDTLVMGGHSTSDHMSFGDNDPAKSTKLNEKLVLDFSDGSEITQYANLFKNAKILLTGCSNGEGGNKKDNMVNFFKKTIGKEAHQITGAKIPVNTYFQFDSNGKRTGLKFFDTSEDELLDKEIYTIKKESPKK